SMHVTSESSPRSVLWQSRAHRKRIRSCVYQLLQVLTDAALILVSFSIAYWMRYILDWPPAFRWIVREVATQNRVDPIAFQPFALLLLALLLTLFTMKGLYRLPRTAGLLDHIGIIGSSTTIAIAVFIVVVFL